jgi:hypothetical protein
MFRKEVIDMKKVLNSKALAKEASFWGDLKKITKENPMKACHK